MGRPKSTGWAPSNADEVTLDFIQSRYAYDPISGLVTSKRLGQVVGSKNARGRIVIRLRNFQLYAHRVAAALMLGRLLGCDEHIDHINGDPSDNRWSNLRVVCNAENIHNQWGPRSSSASGLRGVSPHKTGKWNVQIRLDWKIIYLGLFEDPELGHEAYLCAKRLLHPSAPHELHDDGLKFIDITPLGANFHRRLEKLFENHPPASASVPSIKGAQQKAHGPGANLTS